MYPGIAKIVYMRSLNDEFLKADSVEIANMHFFYMFQTGRFLMFV
jgi:hypothetical protein